MKILLSLLAFAIMLASCSTMDISSGRWPVRTYDPEICPKDPKHLLSKDNIVRIHDFVWQVNPRRRIFAITAIDQKTVLVCCAYNPGDRVGRSEAFDLIRSGDSWKHGTYHARRVLQSL
jgi:hypothetical protein